MLKIPRLGNPVWPTWTSPRPWAERSFLVSAEYRQAQRRSCLTSKTGPRFGSLQRGAAPRGFSSKENERKLGGARTSAPSPGGEAACDDNPAATLLLFPREQNLNRCAPPPGAWPQGARHSHGRNQMADGEAAKKPPTKPATKIDGLEHAVDNLPNIHTTAVDRFDLRRAGYAELRLLSCLLKSPDPWAH